jgi:hypothetical protein
MVLAGSTTALGQGQGHGEVPVPLKLLNFPKSSNGSVTHTPNKLLPTGDISHGLARVELSSANSLPFQLDRYLTFPFTPLSINC